jgi:outer membrane protein assembly factor BamB
MNLATPVRSRLCATNVFAAFGIACIATMGVQPAVQAAEAPVAKPRAEEASLSPSPLIERPSKETYSVLIEFQASLQAGAYREACQAITKSAVSRLHGMVPSPHDPSLLVSLPVALESAMRDDAALLQAMREHFSTLGHLRLKRAIAADNAALVEAVTVQFCTTEAAAEAHAWLADRDLSGGRIPQAVGHYRRAIDVASAARKAELAPRLRLAGAMLGENIGQPPAATVEIGPNRLSPAAFEQLVRQMRGAWARNAASDVAVAEPGGTRRPVVPDAYECVKWARFEAQDYGRPAGAPERGLDWAGRQIGVAFGGTQMIVGNPSELAAYELQSGKRQWVQRSSRGGALSGGALLPMRPLAAGARVYVRSWTEAGPELLCRDLSDGRLVWSANPAAYVVSDPMLVGQSLLALTMRKDSAQQASLLLTEFQARTGSVIAEAPLAEFNTGQGATWDRYSCRAAIADDRIIATMAGCVLCCDLSGRVLWIRRQPWTAPPSSAAAAASYRRQRHEPPLVRDGRAMLSQPGVAEVQCIEVATGRVPWRSAAESPSVLGCIGARLIIETADGFQSLDVESGKLLWRHDSGPRFDGRLCDPRAGIVYLRRTPTDGPRHEVPATLVDLDPQTGHARGEASVRLPQQGDPLLGPLIARGDRLWVFVSAGNPAVRDIVELRPSTEKTEKND